MQTSSEDPINTKSQQLLRIYTAPGTRRVGHFLLRVHTCVHHWYWFVLGRLTKQYTQVLQSLYIQHCTNSFESKQCQHWRMCLLGIACMCCCSVLRWLPNTSPARTSCRRSKDLDCMYLSKNFRLRRAAKVPKIKESPDLSFPCSDTSPWQPIRK